MNPTSAPISAIIESFATMFISGITPSFAARAIQRTAHAGLNRDPCVERSELRSGGGRRAGDAGGQRQAGELGGRWQRADRAGGLRPGPGVSQALASRVGPRHCLGGELVAMLAGRAVPGEE